MPRLLLLLVAFCLYIQICESQTETVITNAAFQDIAPCPCDLTGGSCDIGCCCDAECSDSQRATFNSCIAFLPGGQDGEVQRYKCTSEHFNKADWFPLTCVVFEYNAFLGYFYDWQSKLPNATQPFLSRLYSTSFYWYRETESRTVTDTNAKGYKYGISMKTGKLQSDNAIVEALGVLTLPQPTLTGTCIPTAPVRYLKNFDSTCPVDVSASLCSDSSVLSQLHYIQSSSLNLTKKYFSVMEEEAGVVIAETNVVYKCVDSTYLNPYLKSTAVLSDSVTNTQVYKFGYNLPSDPACVDSCGNDICVDLNNTPDQPVVAKDTLPNCPSQVPTGPTLTGAGAAQSCNNAVIDVDYTVTWVANKVVKLDAIVIMANVPLLTGGAVTSLSQKFKTAFTHNATTPTTAPTDNFNNITGAPYARSGKVGYEIGKEIDSGSMVTNSTTSAFLFVNTNSSRNMAVISPAADGLCVNAAHRSIKFGENTHSECRLMLNRTEFDDCSGLRKLIINGLNSIMPSDVLGRRGYNDITDSSYWVEVLRENLTMLCVASEYHPVGRSPVDDQSGICRNITTGIHLTIMYGETGRSNDYPIYEILGSKVSYSTGTWKVSCPAPADGACTGSTSQPFYLTTSVRFVQIPAQSPTPIAKYYETPEEDDKELCPGDRCWDNLFYPFSGRYNTDSREYVFGMVSVTIIFFIGYLLVTRPWW